jgi:hypothetical protein
MSLKNNQLIDIDSFKSSGVNANTIIKLYKKFGLNTRLRYISIKNKHLNKIQLKLKKSYIIGKEFKNQINNFKNFKQNLKLSKINKK